MEQIATVYYGCGIHLTDVKFIKPEYHPTISGAWIQALQKLNPHILETSNNVNENYYAIESLYQVTLWSIDQKGKCTEMESEDYPGCILPLGNQPTLFGGIGHSYQSAIDTLRNKYEKIPLTSLNVQFNMVDKRLAVRFIWYQQKVTSCVFQPLHSTKICTTTVSHVTVKQRTRLTLKDMRFASV